MQIDKIIKREVISLVVSLVLILIMFIGVSYSSFLAVDESENQNVISMGDIDFAFCRDASCNSTITNYGQKIGFQTVDGVTSAMDIYPYESATEALKQTPYIFNIKNTGSLDLYIDVELKEDDTFIPEGDFASYTKTTEIYSNNIKIGISNCDNGVINTNNVVISTYGSLVNNKILQKQQLKKGENATYCVWTWLDENTPNEVQKTYFVADLSVVGEFLPSASVGRTCLNQKIGECFKNNYAVYGMMAAVSASTGNQNYTSTEYRYQGANPNNYVKFNDELWRIIGTFEVQTPNRDSSNVVTGYTKEYRLKIMRDEPIGEAYYNQTNSATNFNDWTTSTLMKLLNTGAYYNASDASNVTACSGVSSCNYTQTGLKVASRDMIAETKWYLGNVPYGKKLLETYVAERSTAVQSGNKQTWDGKVALLYPSDYMLANRLKYNSAILSSDTSWKTENYLYLTDKAQQLLNPNTASTDRAYHIATTGQVDNYTVNNALRYIRPALYLSSSVLLVGNGDGTKEHPYELSLVSSDE